MDKPIPADIEGLKIYIGGVVLELFQTRGMANAGAQALASAEKERDELKAKVAELEETLRNA